MPSRDEAPENAIINPMDAFLDTDFGPTPVAPSGSFVPAVAVYETEPIPEATEENFICLRGPCRYYLEMRPVFQAGNTKGSLETRLIQAYRTCGRITGYELQLTDECMHDCSDWDPLSKEETDAREERRRKNYWDRPDKAEIIVKIRANRLGKEIKL